MTFVRPCADRFGEVMMAQICMQPTNLEQIELFELTMQFKKTYKDEVIHIRKLPFDDGVMLLTDFWFMGDRVRDIARFEFSLELWNEQNQQKELVKAE